MSADIQALAELGRWEEAEERARELLTQDPDDPDLWTQLGRSLLMQQRLDDAEAAMSRALVLNPDLEWGLRVSARIALERRDWDEALRRSARALEVDPESALGHGIAAEAHIRNKDFDAGIDHASRSIELDPDRIVGHAWLAIGLRCKGLSALALEAAQRGLQHRPESADLHLQAAKALEILDRTEEAAEHLVAAGRSAPESEAPKEGLRRLVDNKVTKTMGAALAMTVAYGSKAVFRETANAAGELQLTHWFDYVALLIGVLVAMAISYPIVMGIMKLAARYHRRKAIKALPPAARRVLEFEKA